MPCITLRCTAATTCRACSGGLRGVSSPHLHPAYITSPQVAVFKSSFILASLQLCADLTRTARSASPFRRIINLSDPSFIASQVHPRCVVGPSPPPPIFPFSQSNVDMHMQHLRDNSINRITATSPPSRPLSVPVEPPVAPAPARTQLTISRPTTTLLLHQGTHEQHLNRVHVIRHYRQGNNFRLLC